MKPEVKNEFQEVYQEIDGLKERIEKLEVLHLHGFPVAGSLEELFGDHPNPYPPPEPLNEARPEREAQHPGDKRLDNRIFKPEGHPEYDEKQCVKLYKAVFAPLKQGIEDAELNLIDAVYAFLDHRDNYPDNPYGHDVEIRAWGEQDYLNYEALRKAARALSDL